MLTLPSVPIPPAARLRQKYCGTKALLSIVRAKADTVVGIRERTKKLIQNTGLTVATWTDPVELVLALATEEVLKA
jgi:hypothetical protein